MRLPILAPILVLMASTAWGQTVLHGLVMEEGSIRVLPGAHVRWEGSSSGAACDMDGRFSLPWPKAGRAVLVVSHTGHATARLPLWARQPNESPVVVTLAVRAVDLDPFEVAARPVPEPVYQRADLHVGAFAVNAHGLWVLAYEKPRLWHREEDAGAQVLLASRMVLLDSAFKELGSIQLPAPVKRLVRDHARRVIAEGEQESWMALPDARGIQLQRIASQTLRDQVLPWTDSTAGRLIGNNRNESYPAYDHVMHRTDDGSDLLICSVRDDFVMELFRSQYKYMTGRDKVIAMDLELETGVDREVIAGYMTGFSRDPYFKLPYAPMFRVRDTLCVFDHASGRIMRFDIDGRVAGESTMRHHQERTFKRLLIQDAVSEKVYALFRRGQVAVLRSVDSRTGALGPERALTYPHPEEVQVHEGFAYYVYRPFESTQKRTLYRERIAE